MPPLVDELFQQVLDKAQTTHDPFEQAFFAMVRKGIRILSLLRGFIEENSSVRFISSNRRFPDH